MLAAKSIAYSTGASDAAKLMERLGIAEQLKDKIKLVDGVPVAEVVAKGGAEIGMQQINVILPVAGADYVGPLPAELQSYVDFAIGVLAVSKQPAAAQALVKFMSSPEAAPLIRKSGMEPPPGLTGICQAKWRKGGIAPKPRRARHSVRVRLPGHLSAPRSRLW